jgi:hypothetical protein
LLFRDWFLKSIAMLNKVVSSFNLLNAELNPIYHFLALLGAHPIIHISGVRVNYTKAKQKSSVGDLPSIVLPHIPLTHVAISVLMNVDDDKYMLTLTDIKFFGPICIDQGGGGKECNKSQNVESLEPSLTPFLRLTKATLHQLNMIIN